MVAYNTLLFLQTGVFSSFRIFISDTLREHRGLISLARYTVQYCSYQMIYDIVIWIS